MTASIDSAEKICPKCGHISRMSAKNCVQCGTSFFLVSIQGEVRKRCTNCGHYNRESAKVCTHCGQQYRVLQIVSRRQMQKWCPNCGAARKVSAKVCTQCGYRFVEPPIRQPEVLADTLTQRIKAAPPRPGTPRPAFDLSGEPAPYISSQDLNRLRLTGRSRWDFVLQVIRSLLGDDR